MLEIGFSQVNCLELRTLKYSSLQVGMLRIRELQIKTLRLSILICSRASAEYGQDGLDIRAQPSFLVGSIESLVESVEALSVSSFDSCSSFASLGVFSGSL